MTSSKEARRGGNLARAPECVCWAADVPDHASDLLTRQAAWLSRRLSISIERARLLAGLAFDRRPA